MFPVFQKALRDYRRLMVWLSLGLGVYALLTVSVYPFILREQENLTSMMDALPDEMLAMFMGSTDVEQFDITDPGTYLQARFGSWLVLILGAVAISLAFNAITNEERSGAMDILMSLPVTRRQMLLGRILHTSALLLFVLTVCWLSFVLGGAVIPEFEVSMGDLAMAIYGAFLPLLVIAGFAYFVAALLPSSRKWGGALAYLFMLGSYLLYSFTLLLPDLESIQPLFLFHYYNMGELIHHGISLPNSALLLGVAMLYLGVAIWGFERKDLGV